MKILLQLPKDADLTLVLTNKEHWLAVADGIREGKCNIKSLSLDILQVLPGESTRCGPRLLAAEFLDFRCLSCTLVQL
jgi:hypothetical protein